MLMPTPGSPERFQDALAGRLPSNYRELTYEQQELFSQARAFAAQRGLFKDSNSRFGVALHPIVSPWEPKM
jgi:hypothetical protein